MSLLRREDISRAGSTSRRFARIAVLIVAVLLAIFSAANMDILWEKGIELLRPGSRVDVEGLSTDVINMVSAREFLYVEKSHDVPPFEITGRDIFIDFDPWLRRDISIDMRSADVEGRILPASGAGRPAVPVLGLFRRFHINCPRASFRVLWNDYVFSCEESRLICESTSGEDGLIFMDIPRLTVSRGEDLVAVLSDTRVTDSFQREGAICFSSISSGLIEADIGRLELDMEVISSIGKPERFLVTGKFSGKADIALERNGLRKADAELLSEAGGSVAISRELIDNYIGRMEYGLQRESMKIILESLQDYTFNRGTLRMQLIGDEIMVSVDLDGESGSRKVAFYLHDFFKDGRIVGVPIISARR